MIPDFFQPPETVTHIGLWKSIIGLFLVTFASCVGVEIRIQDKDEDQ